MFLDPEWHELTPAERELLQRLLSVDFTGRDALLEQLSHARGRWVEGSGLPALRLEVPERASAAHVTGRVPVEGKGRDADDSDVYFLLHVVDGKANEVEIFRPDGNPVRQLPTAETLEIMAY